MQFAQVVVQYSADVARGICISKMIEAQFERDRESLKLFDPNYKPPTWDDMAAKYDAEHPTATRVAVE